MAGGWGVYWQEEAQKALKSAMRRVYELEGLDTSTVDETRTHVIMEMYADRAGAAINGGDASDNVCGND